MAAWLRWPDAEAWLQRLDPVAVVGAETYLAALVVISAWSLRSLDSIPLGTYNVDAVGFATGVSVFTWLVSTLVLVLLLGIHVVVRVIRAVRDGGRGGIGELLPRPVVELLVAAATITATLFGGGTALTPARSILFVSAVVGLAVLVHVAVGLGRWVRNPSRTFGEPILAPGEAGWSEGGGAASGLTRLAVGAVGAVGLAVAGALALAGIVLPFLLLGMVLSPPILMAGVWIGAGSYRLLVWVRKQ